MSYTLKHFTADLKKAQQLTPALARQIVEGGTVRGHKLTKKQERFFGTIANDGK